MLGRILSDKMANLASRKHSPARQNGENRWKRVSKSTSWRAPLRRARRRIKSTLGRVAHSAVVIDATLRFAPGRPRETALRIFALNRWIAQTQEILQRALRDVGSATDLVAEQADQAHDAPALLTSTTILYLAAAYELGQVSARLAQTASRLAADTSWAFVHTGNVPEPPPAPARPNVVRHAPVVVILRRSVIVSFSVELARKICRGRAPPIGSIALSVHRN